MIDKIPPMPVMRKTGAMDADMSLASSELSVATMRMISLKNAGSSHLIKNGKL
jgi:hypothetical protein